MYKYKKYVVFGQKRKPGLAGRGYLKNAYICKARIIDGQPKTYE